MIQHKCDKEEEQDKLGFNWIWLNLIQLKPSLSSTFQMSFKHFLFTLYTSTEHTYFLTQIINNSKVTALYIVLKKV